MLQNENFVKLMIISDATWADDNNIGNTFSNLFKGWPTEKISMIYARPDLPNTKVCENFFQISEKRLISGLFNSDNRSGLQVFNIDCEKQKNRDFLLSEMRAGKKIYSFFLQHRWNLFILAREILWKIGRWKTDEFETFIEDFNPQIVLCLACNNIYLNNIQQYIIAHTGSKSVIYFVDDVYSLKKFSLSPLFWVNQIFTRKNLRKTVKLCDSVYTIIDKQKYEYDRSFGVESKLLFKGGIFEEPPIFQYDKTYPFKLVYTGNIYAGRWETLEKIGRSLDSINKDEVQGILDIYTKNELTLKMKKSISEIKSINFKGGIPANQIKEVQSKADILVHVESFKLREKLSTRLSFSTKLVDYFAVGKCILAIGWREAASIDYLKKNNIAVVIEDIDGIEKEIRNLLNNPQTIAEYGKNAWEFGRDYHEINKINNSIREDLFELVETVSDK